VTRLPAILLSAGLAVALVLGPVPRPAAARSEKELQYAAPKVWATAVRFLRVDEGVKIVEKDADAGYVLFELVDDKRTFTGALELVVADDDAGPRVRIVIQIEDRPAYMEAAMIERLEAKIKKELGSAPPRKPPPAPAEKKPKPDKDAPAEDGASPAEK
jgi:hypothetical protein